MRRITLLLCVVAVVVAIVVLTAGTAFAQAETQKYLNSGEFTTTFENPCTGEDILFEGTYRNPVHATLNKNGYHTVSRSTEINATGTGSETGDKYRLINPGGFAESSQFPKTEGEVGGLLVDNEEGILMVVSEGASPNFLIHFLYKVTYDTEDGQPSLVFEAETGGCTSDIETFRTRIA
jgi:hypothetical protein